MKILGLEDKPLGNQTNLYNCPSNLNNIFDQPMPLGHYNRHHLNQGGHKTILPHHIKSSF